MISDLSLFTPIVILLCTSQLYWFYRLSLDLLWGLYSQVAVTVLDDGWELGMDGHIL